MPLFTSMKSWMKSLFSVLEKVGSKKLIKAEALKAVGSIVDKDPSLMDLTVRCRNVVMGCYVVRFERCRTFKRSLVYPAV